MFKKSSKIIISLLLILLMVVNTTYAIVPVIVESKESSGKITSQDTTLESHEEHKEEDENPIESENKQINSVQDEVYSDEQDDLNKQDMKPDTGSIDETILLEESQSNLERKEYITDRFIIKYKSQKGKDDLQKFLGGNLKDREKLRTKKNENIELVNLKKRVGFDALLSEMRKKKVDSEIEYIQPDYEMTVASLDPHYDSQWALYNKEKVTEADDIPLYTPPEPPSEAKYSEVTSAYKEKINLTDLTVEDENEFTNKLENKYEDSSNYNTSKDVLEVLIPVSDSNTTQQGIKAEKQSFSVDADVPEAWEQSIGMGAIVAVLDTGIDITHEDLSENIWRNSAEIPENGIDDDGNGFVDDSCGWNFSDDNNEVHNKDLIHDEWHGTHVAGIIAAQKDNNLGIAGVAPGAKVMPLKVFKNGTAYTSDIIDAIKYAEDMGAKIANCSFGTTIYNQALKDAIDSSSMLFVCAAGNSHVNIDAVPIYPASFDSSNIIAVTSLGRNGLLSRFSNYGEYTVDLAAPGEDIISTMPDNKYNISSGTSMANAFVSGEAALIMSKYGDINASVVKEKIMISSDRLSSLTGKVAAGNKINCGNAVLGHASSDVILIDSKELFYENDIINQTTGEFGLYGNGAWTPKASLPVVGSGMRAVAVNGKIYVMVCSPTNAVYQYDPMTDTWTWKSNMPTGRSTPAIAAVNGKIYVIGGSEGTQLKRVEEYDPATNTWTTKADMPTARARLTAAVVDNIIYVMGGFSDRDLNTVEAYNPTTNTWTTKASMIKVRYAPAAAAINGRIYVAGGMRDNSMEMYDPVNNTWAMKASMSMKKFCASGASINGKFYVAGGFSFEGGNLSTMEEYIAETDTWSLCPSMSYSRQDLGSADLGNEIYVMGGTGGTSLNSMESYTPFLADDDYGNDFISASTIQINSEVQGCIEIPGDVDFLKFVPSAGGTYNIYSMGLIDTYGHLYDSTGNQLTYDDDAGERKNFNMIRTLTANQTYYIKVRHAGPSCTGLYKVRVDIVNPMTLSATSTGYRINLSWPAVSGAAGYVLEADNMVVDVGTSTAYVHTGITPGTSHYYRVRVKNALGSSNGYTFSTQNDDHGDDMTMATPMTAETEIAGRINYPFEEDYFKFVPNVSATYDIFTVGSTDTYGYLYNSSGTQLANNDDNDENPVSYNFRISMSMQAGQAYYIKVRDCFNNIGDYGLRVSKMIPAPTISATVLNNSITATWSNVSGATGYDVQVDGSMIDNGVSTTYVHSGLMFHVPHSYRVRAKNSLNIGKWSDRVFALPQGSIWQFKAQMPTARHYLGVVEVGGMIYAIGGYNGSTYINTVEMYNPETNTWTTKSSMPTARGRMGVTVLNGKIYAIGGYSSSGYLNTVEEYDPITNMWTTKASMPTSRNNLGVIAVNGKICAIGGNNSSTLNIVEEFNPSTNTWTTKTSMPTARHSFGITSVNGKVYAIGGYNGSYLSTVEEFDPVSNTWATKVSMPTARYGLGVATINGKVYSIGGYNVSGYLSAVEIFDPINNTWKTNIAKPIKSYYSGVISVDDNMIYVVGGYSDYGYLDTVEKFEYSQPLETRCTIDCTSGETFNYILQLKNTNNFIGRIFTITYNSSEISVVDLSKRTYIKETATGAISGTDLTIIQNSPGIIKFTVNKTIAGDKVWSGVINIIEFKSAVSGPITLNCKEE